MFVALCIILSIIWLVGIVLFYGLGSVYETRWDWKTILLLIAWPGVVAALLLLEAFKRPKEGNDPPVA
jgi:hypothetical protein